jgi:hypothetical protein
LQNIFVVVTAEYCNNMVVLPDGTPETEPLRSLFGFFTPSRLPLARTQTPTPGHHHHFVHTTLPPPPIIRHRHLTRHTRNRKPFAKPSRQGPALLFIFIFIFLLHTELYEEFCISDHLSVHPHM